MPRALSISKLVLSTRSVGGALICWGGLSAFSAATLSIGPIRFLLPVLHSVGKTRVSWCTGSGVPGRVRVRAQTGRRVRLPGAQLRQDHSSLLQLEARLRQSVTRSTTWLAASSQGSAQRGQFSTSSGKQGFVSLFDHAILRF